MNVFILDAIPEKNVQYHADKHVVKMITEYVQLLSTTLHLIGRSDIAPFRMTHKNHPVCKWVRESSDNFKYLWELADLLGDEYTYRYGKVHKSHIYLRKIPKYIEELPNVGITPFVNCTPYKEEKNVVLAYRMFYNIDKRKFATWKNRSKPEWFN